MKLSIPDCGKSKSVREAETVVNHVVGTNEDIDKVGVTHEKDESKFTAIQYSQFMNSPFFAAPLGGCC